MEVILDWLLDRVEPAFVRPPLCWLISALLWAKDLIEPRR